MDLDPVDDIEVISSFLGPTPSLRRWGWALFFCPWEGQDWESQSWARGLLRESGLQDEIEVISSFLGPTPSLRRWGWALFFF